MTQTLLRIDSSARQSGSTSRALVDAYVDTLRTGGDVTVISRDVSEGLPLVSSDWIAGAYTPAEARTGDQQAALATSDALIAELQAADTIVIGMPIYNFGMPAALKLWIDQVARAGVTFRYTDTGPEGLLSGKRAVIVVASGGTESGSDIDFATPHLIHVLGFLGIDDVTVFAADQIMMAGEDTIESVRERITAFANS